MLRNYFKIAWRNLWKNKTSTLINIIGLSTGLICFILIFLFVQDEMSYDSFHDHPEQVYRVVKDFVNEDGSHIPDATTPPALAPALQKDIPEVAQVTRLFPSWGRRYILQVGDRKFNEQKLIRVDSNFFEIFTFPFVSGNKSNALMNPHSIVLTESAARKYFGNENPIGKTIKLDIDRGTDYAVSAVVKDVPANSHFTFDFLIPLKFSGGDINNDWGWYNYYTYVRLKDGASFNSFEKKLQPLYKKYRPEEDNQFYAQALTNIHLDSRLKWELSSNGDRSYVHIMMAIALFVILIAGINYVNLATARSAKRAKEVGIRKVTGANKSLLIGQFLSESLMIVFCSLIISLIIAALLLSPFNQLMDKKLILFSLANLETWIIILGITVGVGLCAGLYPAFYLARFQPTDVLKSSIVRVTKGAFLRKGLVTFQFVISIAMITSIMIISSQIKYIRTKKLGFDKENIVILQNAGRLPDKEAFKYELKKIPSIKDVGGADGILGGQNWTTNARPRGTKDGNLLNFLTVDYDFLHTMGLQFLEGRNFSRDFGKDSSAVILNETAVQNMGMKKPVVGSQIIFGDKDTVTNYGDVIGMVKDFHFSNFHEPIKPFGFILDGQRNSRINTLFIKIAPGNTESSLSSIEKVWAKAMPSQPIEYSFQDQQLEALYRSEMKLQKLFAYLTAIAIVIACLGLFGLASFTAEQRTKEIGIRKVLGASVESLATLLSKDFIILVIIAILIASPIAWYFMKNWLQDFAYRVNINWWTFGIAGLAALVIALITVSFQAIKAALANPIKNLRTE